MNLALTSYIFGASTMFYGMTAWLFWRAGSKLSRLVALLMATVCLECVKDILFLESDMFFTDFGWSVMTAVDMVAVPMYAFILMELVRPGSVTRRTMVIHEIPFIVLPVLMVAFHNLLFFRILVVYGAVYGTFYLIWTAVNIPRYHRQLRERFSYTENINLNWLRLILATFYVILMLWILDCVVIHVEIENLYMVASLVMWMVIDFYLYKHENVIDELSGVDTPAPPADTAGDADAEADFSDLSRRIRHLFTIDKVYLNSHLKLSDIASAAGSNRTYVSNFFNREAASSFFDYVNGFRIEHACRLLTESDATIREIAEQSGYNSPQTFIRVFTRFKGVSPTEYRIQNNVGR